MRPFALLTLFLALALTLASPVPSTECQGITDTCAKINQDLFINVNEGAPYNTGPLKATLCTSQVQAFVEQHEHDSLQTAVGLIGASGVESVITQLIEQAGDDSTTCVTTPTTRVRVRQQGVTPNTPGDDATTVDIYDPWDYGPTYGIGGE